MNWYKLAQEEIPEEPVENDSEYIDRIILDRVTPGKWTKIFRKMKSLGYDFYNADDTKEIFYNLVDRNKNKKMYKNVFADHYNALIEAISTVGNNDSFQSKNQLAKNPARQFGLTGDIREAGYIMPNGSMLDFSGRKDGFQGRGSRNMDHREINEIIPDELLGESSSTGMYAFMGMGAIRCNISGDTGNIDIAVAPTKQQYSVIGKMVDFCRGQFRVDFFDNKSALDYGEYAEDFRKKYSSWMVIRDIQTHFKG